MALITLTAVILTLTTALTNGVRLCVTPRGVAACDTFLNDPASANLNLQCVPGRDRYDCLHKIIQKEADVMRTAPEDVFLARNLYDTQLHIIAESRKFEEKEEPWRYKGVAVVRKSSIKSLADLKGSKSCHTGYQRNAGWNIPFSHLLEKGEIKLNCSHEMTVVEHDLRAVSSYFGLACIPGQWVPDKETDIKLKSQYNNLCTMCSDPARCDSVDEHAGYTGALRCLVDSHGDVAWSKIIAVNKFFKSRTDINPSEYGLLCPDGVVVDVDSAKPCYWAARPWSSWVARASNLNKKEIVTELTKVMELATRPSEVNNSTLRPWAEDLLNVYSHTVIHPRQPSVTPHDYLKEPGYDTTIDRLGCPEVPVRLCVDTDLEKEKCTALNHVLKSRRVRPSLECVMPPPDDDCLAMVASGSAHITTADGGDVFRGHIEYGLFPVVSEVYGHLDASYYAVAVVRANSGITSLSQLKGKNSCHTGIDKTAGWKIPVVSLLEAGLLKAGDCDYPGQIGRFFNNSCAPGAKSPKYDPRGTNPDSLCQLCAGTEVGGASGPAYKGANKPPGACERNPSESYYGYTGAFRCLVEGGGDVAFVKHTTVPENTNGNNPEEWAKNLRALDYKLLCKATGVEEVAGYKNCHLARVPAHKVLTGNESDKTLLEEIRILLLRASDELPKGQDIFVLFGPYQGRKDIIFKDSATGLVNVRQDIFHQSLEEEYFRALTEINNCRPKESQEPLTMNGSSTLAHHPLSFLHLLSYSTILVYLLSR